MSTSQTLATLGDELANLLLTELRGEGGRDRWSRNSEREKRGALTVSDGADFRRLALSLAVTTQQHLALEGVDVDNVNPAMVDRFNDHMLTAGED